MTSKQSQGPYTDLALHTIGWKAFQDMAAQICEERLDTPVTIHHEARDGGQDAVFLIPATVKNARPNGTVQVKYSSDPNRSLKLSDLTPEVEKLQELIVAGEAEKYIFVTNMSVLAPDAKEIRDRLRKLGVKEPEVWGKQQITLTIRSSSKLRALVPQVYGLGDLTSIIDHRAIEQTKAILKTWLPKLKAYVPTKSHERAVRTLDKHGVVLLLGNPASGKSTIGAILSTMAVENDDHSVIQISSPHEFVQHWNPDDKNRFFWIDDAFGSNVVDSGLVQQWAKEFGKVSAAIKGGNRFLFTSRGYIYKGAEKRLGSRNLAPFRSGEAVVDVGDLQDAEKAQILYNHVKHGGQSDDWRSKVKRYLAAVVKVPDFLPGISERLGNPDFTKKLLITERALCAFMAEPEEHLIDVLNELETEQFAALVLVYVHRGRLDLDDPDQGAVRAVEENTNCRLAEIIGRLPELEGSFTRKVSETSDQVWGFEHPTISDAITSILGERPNMTSAIVRGGPIEKVLNEFVCEEGPATLNAAKIPKSLNAVLNHRLAEVPNNLRSNGDLFDFLAVRASDDIIVHQFGNHPELMDRTTYTYDRAGYEARYIAAARAFHLGVLDPRERSAISDHLFLRALSFLDLSWIEDSKLLAFMEPRTMMSLGVSLTLKVRNGFDDFLEEKRIDIDLDLDIEDQYDVISGGLRSLRELLEDRDITEDTDFLARAEERLKEEIAQVLRVQESYRSENSDEGDWDVFSPNSTKATIVGSEQHPSNSRSIFMDVDVG